MCLTVEKVIKSRAKSQIVYKVLQVNQGELRSLVYPYTWKAGVNEASGTLYQGNVLPGYSVFGGAFHVYRTKARAEAVARGYGDRSYVAVPFRAFTKDYVAHGTKGEACYTKLTLNKNTLRKILSEYEWDTQEDRVKQVTKFSRARMQVIVDELDYYNLEPGAKEFFSARKKKLVAVVGEVKKLLNKLPKER